MPFSLSSSTLSAASLVALIEAAERLAQHSGLSPDDAAASMVDFAGNPRCDEGSDASISNARVLNFVERLQRLRHIRNQTVGSDLFRDPAWDMLLDLMVSQQRDQRTSVSALCLSAGVPPTTALRHVQRLEALGLLRRSGDPDDARRQWVECDETIIDRLMMLNRRLLQVANAA